MEKAQTKPSQLSWIKQDYLSAGEEVPDILLSDDIHTEGELMTRQDIEDWIDDTIRTFTVIRQESKTQFEVLYEEFCTDIDYLVKIKQLSSDESAGLKNKKLFTL